MSEKRKKIFIAAFGILGILYLCEQLYFIRDKLESSRIDRDLKNRATAVAVKSHRNKEINSYISCDLGASACFKLYPEGAKAVIEAKESSQTNSGY